MRTWLRTAWVPKRGGQRPLRRGARKDAAIWRAVREEDDLVSRPGVRGHELVASRGYTMPESGEAQKAPSRMPTS